jgi:filamentous hemagglutinin family protein
MKHTDPSLKPAQKRLGVGCLTVGLWVTTQISAPAQVIPDTTLGSENSIVVPNVEINGLSSDQIQGGAIRGANLFHSLQQLNVVEGRGAYFSNPANIERIFTRVTGGNVSQILGTLGVLGNADLFLVNPNGILFGPNAKLDLKGSFIGTTASNIQFADGTEFSATNPVSNSLLTVNVPIGLQFGSNPGNIVNQSQATETALDGTELITGLRVQPGKTLALVGGNVTLNGGYLTAPEGRIELGSVGENRPLSLQEINQNWVLGYEDVPSFRDINLSQAAIVDASGEGGGAIQVTGRRVTLTEDAQIVSQTFGDRNGGSIDVNATESVNLSGDSTSFAIRTFGTGTAGNLTVTTQQMILQAGGFMETSTSGEGQAGNLTVKASESVELVGTTSDGAFPSGLFAQVGEEASGNAGILIIETGRFVVRDGAQVNATTASVGQAGNLIVKATESVELSGVSSNGVAAGLFTQVFPDATGRGGNLTVETNRLMIRDGALLDATTLGAGRAGDLTVKADVIELIGKDPNPMFGGGISTGVDAGATGNGGNLSIDTRRLSIRGGGQIATATRGEGNGGQLTINASESIDIQGFGPQADLVRGSSGLFVSAEEGSTGTAGNLVLNTPILRVADGAKITANTFGPGNGGDAILNVRQLWVQNGGSIRAGSFGTGNGGLLIINASDFVQVAGRGQIGGQPVNSSLFTQASDSGNAGSLTINTDFLSVMNGAELTVGSTGTGSAGNLNIQADNIILDNKANLTANSTAGFGDINLDTQNLILRRGSRITTNSQGSEPGGNIMIDAQTLVGLENSDITANAINSRGGQVVINAQGIFGMDFREVESPLTNDITASSELGSQFSGTVEINTPDIDPSSGLITVSANFVDVAALVDQGCIAYSGSSFTVTGRGGIPPSPYELLSSDTPLVDIRTTLGEAEDTNTEVSPQTSVPATPLVEATGWTLSSQGEVMLTTNQSFVPAGCSKVVQIRF